MNFSSNKEKGNAGLALAIGYFGSNGYIVSIPLNDTQDYDLIIDNGNGLKSIQVKATSQRTEYGISKVSLKSSGGTNGSVYKRVSDTNVDYLFVVTELQEMYLIPLTDFSNKSVLNLGIERQKYRVDKVATSYIKEEIIKEVIPLHCSSCGTQITDRGTTGLCLSCYEKSGLSRKVDRPDKETLLNDLLESNFSAVGRKYGVSDNAIRKWCLSYGLPSTAKEIKELKMGKLDSGDSRAL